MEYSENHFGTATTISIARTIDFTRSSESSDPGCGVYTIATCIVLVLVLIYVYVYVYVYVSSISRVRFSR